MTTGHRWGIAVGLMAGALSLAACVSGPGTVAGSDAVAGTTDVSRGFGSGEEMPYLGELRLLACNYNLRGLSFAEGQSMSTLRMASLFRLLGDRFGGDGKHSFALPKPAPLTSTQGQVRYQIALEGNEPRFGDQKQGLGLGYVGEVRLWPGEEVPSGWLPCDGRELPVAGNQVLFTVIGTTYGGDGQATFKLPQLAAVEGMQYIINEQGVFPDHRENAATSLRPVGERALFDTYLSEIRLFAGARVPAGWRDCDGQTYDIRGNDVYFALLYTQYGGDGRTTFAVPKLTFDANPALRYGMAIDGIFPPRN